MATQLSSEPRCDFGDLDVDARLKKRATRILGRWSERPGFGFPQVFENLAELEAAYRFFSNDALTFPDLIRAQVSETAQRCSGMQEVLVLEDTTTFCFGGDTPRDGLGRINKNNQGFLMHTALAATLEGLPLGLAGAEPFVRLKPVKKKGKVPQHKRRESSTCESHRWLRMALEVEQAFEGSSLPIHVMDREGDIYDCFSTLVEKQKRFVIRCAKDRSLVDEDYSLIADALDGLPVRYRDQVTVSPRVGSHLPDQRKLYPARDGRVAEVSIIATKVTVKRTRNSPKHLPPSATLNIVRVFEPAPPEGEHPVLWTLLTSEPIESEADLRKVINIYRCRWLVEEFFKAIKTGCAFEKRQLASYHALKNALAMALPIAWNMLLLRHQSRKNAELPAQDWIDPVRLEVITALAKRHKLPENPTVCDVAYAIAGMGGHLKRNGPPGWHTLRRGFEVLLMYEYAWGEAMKRCDQS